MKKNLSIIILLGISGLPIYGMEGYKTAKPDDTQLSAGKTSKGFGASYQEPIAEKSNAQIQQEIKPGDRLAQAQQQLSKMQNSKQPSGASIDLSQKLKQKGLVINLQDQTISNQSGQLQSNNKTDAQEVTNVKLQIKATEDQINQLRQQIQANNSKGISFSENANNLELFDQATTKLIKLKDEVIRLQNNRIQKQNRTKNLWDSSVNRVNNIIDALKISPQTAAKAKAPVSSIFNIISGKKSSGKQTNDLQSIQANLNDVVTILGKDNARPVLQSMQSEIQAQQPSVQKENQSTNSSSSGSSSVGSNLFDFYVASPGDTILPIKESTVIEGQALGDLVSGAVEVAPVVGQAVAGVAYGAFQLIGALLGGGM